MTRDPNDCTFCKPEPCFPEPFQKIFELEYWLFILNLNPQTDFHSLLVYKPPKNCNAHIEESSDAPEKAMIELGKLLKYASRAIKKCDTSIEKVLIVSLNLGKNTKHLHFHLIPKRKNEFIKRVNNPCEDGGGMFFLARKEIVVDTLKEFFNSTTSHKDDCFYRIYEESKEKRLRENQASLQKEFDEFRSKFGR